MHRATNDGYTRARTKSRRRKHQDDYEEEEEDDDDDDDDDEENQSSKQQMVPKYEYVDILGDLEELNEAPMTCWESLSMGVRRTEKWHFERQRAKLQEQYHELTLNYQEILLERKRVVDSLQPLYAKYRPKIKRLQEIVLPQLRAKQKEGFTMAFAKSIVSNKDLQDTNDVRTLYYLLMKKRDSIRALNMLLAEINDDRTVRYAYIMSMRLAKTISERNRVRADMLRYDITASYKTMTNWINDMTKTKLQIKPIDLYEKSVGARMEAVVKVAEGKRDEDLLTLLLENCVEDFPELLEEEEKEPKHLISPQEEEEEAIMPCAPTENSFKRKNGSKSQIRTMV
jgi:hypothetical protein